MTDMTKTVRALDAETYRVFRAKAVELGLTTGAALTEAMRFWVNAKNRPRVTVRAEAEAPTPAAVNVVVEPPTHPTT